MAHEQAPRDRTWLIVILGGITAVLVGLIAGFLASGGLGADPEAVASTVTTTPGATTVTTSGSSSVLVTAAEDTYVNGAEPGVARGAESPLRVENDPPEVQSALLRFTVEGIPTGEEVSQAVLRLTVAREGSSTVLVSTVGGPWDSSTLFTNAPSVGNPVAEILPGTLEGDQVEVNVTSLVNGNGSYDFYLTTDGDDSIAYESLESGSDAPTLEVAWDGLLLIPPDPENAGSPGTTTASTVPPEAGGPGSEGPVVSPFDDTSDASLTLAGDRQVLVGAGDIADCDYDGAAATAGLIEDLLVEEPETIVFTAGDNAYEDGSEEDFAQCFDPTWGRFKERIRPALGNQEYGVPEARAYFEYFGEGAEGDSDHGYYTYSAGTWRVVVLNTNCDEAGGCGAGSSQEQWLRETLSRSGELCSLAIWHHPLFSSGEHGEDSRVSDLYTALYDFGVEVLVTGHDHDYERFAPQDAAGSFDLEGVRQFVVGTGGAALDPILDVVPNSEVGFSGANGVLRLDLYENGYSWDFLAEEGADFSDSGKNACH